jgi:glycosyltransferase involved in cell wall biosynthesis
VVPLFNEEKSVLPLVDAVRNALPDAWSWELLLVDDGSTDATPLLASAAASADGRIRSLRLSRNFGQTAAMQAGFDHCRGKVVVTMDGDLQNDPSDIPALVSKLSEGYDLVAGYRQRRQDKTLTRKVPSWIANRLIRRLTGVDIRDNGCSLKAYRRELIQRIHLYSDMHRFIPALAAGVAGARITEMPVRHHARRFGYSKYGLSRVARVLADALTVAMIRSFRERPLVLFAAGATSAFVLACIFATIAVFSFSGVERTATIVLPGSALVWVGLGFYLLMLGLIAEVVVRERRLASRDELPVVSVE